MIPQKRFGAVKLNEWPFDRMWANARMREQTVSEYRVDSYSTRWRNVSHIYRVLLLVRARVGILNDNSVFE